jgi:hypothetical protein
MMMVVIMKQIFWIFMGIILFAACDADSEKQSQSIEFSRIAPQQLRDGFIQLQATASSGLPVFFVSWDTATVAIDGSKAIFRKAGTTTVVACQSGNEQFHEAPQMSQRIIIRDWDPNKKDQTISFSLPTEWKLTRDGTVVSLNAEASSGLPVSMVMSPERYGFLSNDFRYLYLYHAGESGLPYTVYRVSISITASQTGNGEYNPADNVTATINVTGDVFH